MKPKLIHPETLATRELSAFALREAARSDAPATPGARKVLRLLASAWRALPPEARFAPIPAPDARPSRVSVTIPSDARPRPILAPAPEDPGALALRRIFPAPASARLAPFPKPGDAFKPEGVTGRLKLPGARFITTPGARSVDPKGRSLPAGARGKLAREAYSKTRSQARATVRLLRDFGLASGVYPPRQADISRSLPSIDPETRSAPRFRFRTLSHEVDIPKAREVHGEAAGDYASAFKAGISTESRRAHEKRRARPRCAKCGRTGRLSAGLCGLCF